MLASSLLIGIMSQGNGAAFPALSNPPVFLFGDSIPAKENFVIGIGANTLTRDGTTHPGRVTAPIANSGLFGTPRVAIVNTLDTSFEVIGRNNYQDSTTTGVSVHTAAADTYAGGAPAFNSTAAGTTTQAIANGDIINLERRSQRGVINHANSLMGGGMNIIANLGHPGVLSSGTGATAEADYAKQLCLAQGSTPLGFVRIGINDIKPGASPNATFAATKVHLDKLTGLDGNGGNAVIAILSCSFVGSAQAGYAVMNEQVIGKCATSGAPTVLNVDSTQYSFSGTPMNTYNYQLYQYALAHPTKLLFIDVSSPSYNFTAQCMYDATFPDANGQFDTGDGTHFTTIAAQKQGVPASTTLTSAGVTFPSVVPRSSGDATTPGGRTRMNNLGPWTTTTVTTGFITGGSASTLLPKGGVAGQPSGWACGRGLGSGTMKLSVWDPGDGKGMWVNAECTAAAANDTLVFEPYGSSGQNLAFFGIGSNVDQSEYELVFEIYWDNAIASGLDTITATLQTNSGGNFGMATNGEVGDFGATDSFMDSSAPSLSRQISTGRVQMSNASITVLNVIISAKMRSILGVTCNVGIRCVGVNKL